MDRSELQELIDQFDIPITVQNESFEIVMQNKFSKKLFENVIGKRCFQIYHGLNYPPDFCRILAALKGDTEWEEFYEQHLNRWLMAKVSIVNLNGERHFLHFVVDITSLKEREMELRRLNELLMLATRIIRHDVLNSLTAVLGYVEAMSEECGELAEKAIRELEISIKLLKHTRELPEPKELTPYSLKRVLDEVTQRYRVNVVIEGDCEVLADDGIYSVFDNLTRNAVEHGKASEIRVSIKPEGEFCKVIFSDNGIGIPEEIREKIFEYGFTTSPKNTGIGPFLVAITMKRYGGEVSLIPSERAAFQLTFKRA